MNTHHQHKDTALHTSPVKNKLTGWSIEPSFPDLNKKYGVLIYIEEDGKENSIKYEVDVRFIKQTDKMNSIIELEITSDVFINDQLPDLLVDKLSYDVGQVCYPLQLEIDRQGKYLSVYNSDEIKERWLSSRGHFLEYYKGNDAKRYFELMDRTMQLKSQIDLSFKDSIFINSYFGPIYKNYTYDFCCQDQFIFYQDKTKIMICAESKLNEYTNEFGSKVIQIEGIEAFPDFVLEEEKNVLIGLDTHYWANYILDGDTNCIKEIHCKWEMLRIKKKIDVIIYEVRDYAKNKRVTIQENRKKGLFSFLWEK